MIQGLVEAIENGLIVNLVVVYGLFSSLRRVFDILVVVLVKIFQNL